MKLFREHELPERAPNLLDTFALALAALAVPEVFFAILAIFAAPETILPPGTIPTAARAAAVATVGYSATGDYKAAARAAVGIVAGAGLVVGAIKVAKVAKKSSGTAKSVKEGMRASVYRSKHFGAASRLFGDKNWKGNLAKRAGAFNGSSKNDRFALGWSATKKDRLGRDLTKNGKPRTVFRAKVFKRHVNLFYGPFRGSHGA